MLTKNGIGNLLNKYEAVLKKCHLINTFGSLAVAGMLLGSAGMAMARQGQVEVVVPGGGTLNQTVADEAAAGDRLIIDGTSGTNGEVSTGGVVDKGDVNLNIVGNNGAASLNVGHDVTLNAIHMLGGDTTLNMNAGATLTANGGVSIEQGILNLTGNAGNVGDNGAAKLQLAEDNLLTLGGADGNKAILNVKGVTEITGEGLTVGVGGGVNVIGDGSGKDSLYLSNSLFMNNATATINVSDKASLLFDVGVQNAAAQITVGAGTINLDDSIVAGWNVQDQVFGATIINLNSADSKLISTGTNLIRGNLILRGGSFVVADALEGGELAITGSLELFSGAYVVSTIYIGEYDESRTESLQVRDVVVGAAGLSNEVLFAISNAASAADGIFVGGTATHSMDITDTKVRISNGGTAHMDLLTITGTRDTLSFNANNATLSTNVLTTPDMTSMDFTRGILHVRGTATPTTVALSTAIDLKDSTLLVGASTPGNLTLGYTGQDVTHGGSVTADITATTGTLTVAGGTWSTAKTVDVKAEGTLNVVAGNLDVSSGTLKVDANAILDTGADGSITAKGSDFLGTGSSMTLTGTGDTTTATLTKGTGFSVETMVTGEGGLVLTDMTNAMLGLESTDVSIDQINAIVTELKAEFMSTGAYVSAQGIAATTWDENASVEDLKPGASISGDAPILGGTVPEGSSVTASQLTGTDVTHVGAGANLTLTDSTQASEGGITNEGGNVNIPNGGAVGGSFTNTSGTAELNNVNVTGVVNVDGGEVTLKNTTVTITEHDGGTIKASGGNLGDYTQAAGAVLEVTQEGEEEPVTFLNFTAGGDTNVGGKDGKGTLIINGELTGSGVIRSGSADNAGDVILVSSSNVESFEGSLFGDPAWQAENNTIDQASTVQVIAGGAFNADAVAGRNSYVTFGMTAEAAEKLFTDAKLTWGNGAGQISAAAFVGDAGVRLGTKGVLIVDGTLTQAGGSSGNYEYAAGATRTYYTGSLAGTSPITDVTGTPAPEKVDDGSAIFAPNSLLVVSGGSFISTADTTSTTYALTGDGNLTVAADAKLLISDAKEGTVNVADFAAGGTVWDKGNISVSGLFAVENVLGTSDQFQVVLTTSTEHIEKTHSKLDSSAAALLNNLVEKGYTAYGTVKSPADIDTWNTNNPNTPFNAGAAILMRAFEPGYGPDNNPKQAAAIVQGAAQVGALAAAPTTVSVVSGVGASAPQARFDPDAPTQVGLVTLPVGVDESGMSAGNSGGAGVGVWLTPLYKYTSAYGFNAGNLESGYNTDLGGLAIGADITTLVDDAALTVGLSFNLGTGHTTSTGDFDDTTNSFDFWGLSAYGAFAKNNLSLLLDIGYSGVWNSINHDLFSGIGMGDLEASFNSHAWTVGVRGDYLIETSALDITPHVGIRYTYSHVDSYEIDSAGYGTAFDVEATDQSVWTFPVGVTFSKDIETSNDWMFTPSLDVGFVAAAGDLDVTTRSRLPGAAASAGQMELDMETADGFTFDGGLGLGISNGAFSVDVNYNLQLSEHVASHMVMGTFRYEF